MAEVKFKCTGESGRCGKEFKPGEWECFPGQKHVVAPKTYFMADAPHCDFKTDPNGIAFRSSRTYLHAVPEETYTDNMGKIVTSSHPPAMFTAGRFETSDPQYQYYLEHGTAARSLCSEERWFDVYHTPIQKQNIKDGQLKARAAELESKAVEVERKERELNDLLEQVKKAKGGAK